MSDEQKIMGCTPTSEPADVPGVTEGTCCDCGTAVWTSPSAIKMMAQDPTIVTVCMPCIEKRWGRELEDHEIKIHPLQIGELLAYFEGERRRN